MEKSPRKRRPNIKSLRAKKDSMVGTSMVFEMPRMLAKEFTGTRHGPENRYVRVLVIGECGVHWSLEKCCIEEGKG